MEKTANRIASFFIAQGAAEEDDRDIYVYGLTIGLSTAVNILVTAVIGVICGIPLKMLAYILPYTALRLSAGGSHANSFWGCVSVSAVIQITTALLILYTPENLQAPAAAILLAVTAALIFKFAPVEHPNRPISTPERAGFRLRARATILAEALVCLTLILLQIRVYPFCIALGAAVSGILLLPGLSGRKSRYKGGES
ncbi:MAG: accessory gene regulator B family protein [Oscillospiraceae bacterium]|jgi:accessory gene regulator B|nr:accessory gene regulator B family protein [Oscillospiraceae bacterium]